MSNGSSHQTITLNDDTLLHCSGSIVGVYVYLDETRTERALEFVYDIPKDGEGRWRIVEGYKRDLETRKLIWGSPLLNRFTTPQLNEILEAVKETYGNYGRPMASL